MKINNVVVIGSGTMGSGIAAQLCNANIPVTLLDLKTEISQKAKERIEKSRPPLLIDKSKIHGIKVGNISDDFKDFCITHFFNPVRYMDLLEIVKNEKTDLDKINQLQKFCEVDLGKGAIVCNDTPGFLGNRIGVYAMQVAMTEAFKMKLSIEEADAVFGRPMGIPKTGVFGLYDLIGIDLMLSLIHI